MKSILYTVLLQQILTGNYAGASGIYRSNGELTGSTDFIDALSTHSTTRATVFKSPQCWIGTFQEILRTNLDHINYDDQTIFSHNPLADLPGGSICSIMTGDQRAQLALELTKCFFTESYLKFSSECDSNMANEDIKVCIQSLNSSEFAAYTEFYTQIYNICTQLSQEAWNAKLMESTYLLFESSRDFSHNLDQIVSHHRSEWDNFNAQYRAEQEAYFHQMNEVSVKR